MSEEDVHVLVAGKTFEEMVELHESDPDMFERWRSLVLQEEISKLPILRQGRLQLVLNGLEIRMSRYGEGVARYNAIVGEFFDVTLPVFHETLQGKITPPEEKSNVVVSLFRDNNKPGT